MLFSGDCIAVLTIVASSTTAPGTVAARRASVVVAATVSSIYAATFVASTTSVAAVSVSASAVIRITLVKATSSLAPIKVFPRLTNGSHNFQEVVDINGKGGLWGKCIYKHLVMPAKWCMSDRR